MGLFSLLEWKELCYTRPCCLLFISSRLTCMRLFVYITFFCLEISVCCFGPLQTKAAQKSLSKMQEIIQGWAMTHSIQFSEACFPPALHFQRVPGCNTDQIAYKTLKLNNGKPCIFARIWLPWCLGLQPWTDLLNPLLQFIFRSHQGLRASAHSSAVDIFMT